MIKRFDYLPSYHYEEQTITGGAGQLSPASPENVKLKIYGATPRKSPNVFHWDLMLGDSSMRDGDLVYTMDSNDNSKVYIHGTANNNSLSLDLLNPLDLNTEYLIATDLTDSRLSLEYDGTTFTYAHPLYFKTPASMINSNGGIESRMLYVNVNSTLSIDISFKICIVKLSDIKWDVFSSFVDDYRRVTFDAHYNSGLEAGLGLLSVNGNVGKSCGNLLTPTIIPKYETSTIQYGTKYSNNSNYHGGITLVSDINYGENSGTSIESPILLSNNEMCVAAYINKISSSASGTDYTDVSLLIRYYWLPGENNLPPYGYETNIELESNGVTKYITKVSPSSNAQDITIEDDLTDVFSNGDVTITVNPTYKSGSLTLPKGIYSNINGNASTNTTKIIAQYYTY